jgi:hypothetical protein
MKQELVHKSTAPCRQYFMQLLNTINGKKRLSLKPVVRTLRSYTTAGLIKQQKSVQELAMYGHEVFDVLTKASKLIRDTLSSEVAVKSCCVFVRKP